MGARPVNDIMTTAFVQDPPAAVAAHPAANDPAPPVAPPVAPPAPEWPSTMCRVMCLLATVFRHARAIAALSLTWVRVHARHLLLGPPPSQDGIWRMYQAHAFLDAVPTRDVPMSCELTRFVGHEPRRVADWASVARDHARWTTPEDGPVRLEVRYTAHGKPYRLLLREKDVLDFPPYDPAEPRCPMPRGIISARLLNSEKDVDYDVTSRVVKYQGPKGDFHAGLGAYVRVQDMFPFDDQADNAARFKVLRVMDVTGRVRDFPYADNPIVI